MLGEPNFVGLTSGLRGRQKPRALRARARAGDPGRPHGPVPSDPALLETGRFVEVVRGLEAGRDAVILDAPVAASVLRSSSLSRSFDGVLLVVHASRTSKSTARATTDDLLDAGINLLGSCSTDPPRGGAVVREGWSLRTIAVGREADRGNGRGEELPDGTAARRIQGRGAAGARRNLRLRVAQPGPLHRRALAAGSRRQPGAAPRDHSRARLLRGRASGGLGHGRVAGGARRHQGPLDGVDHKPDRDRARSCAPRCTWRSSSLALAALASARQVGPLMDVAILMVAAVAGYGLLQKINPVQYPIDSLDDVRIDSTLEYVNTTAAVLGMGVALVLARMTTIRNALLRGLYAAVTLAFLVTLYLTVSRGGIGALGVGMIALLILTEKRLQLLVNLLLLSVPGAWLCGGSRASRASCRPASPTSRG